MFAAFWELKCFGILVIGLLILTGLIKGVPLLPDILNSSDTPEGLLDPLIIGIALKTLFIQLLSCVEVSLAKG